ncbi:hypothetical protein ACFQX6_02635 [Streptosporangium lutulentum]
MAKNLLKTTAVLAEKSTLLAAARMERFEAATVLDGTTAEVDAERRRLRQTAADRNMPSDAAEVETIARAIADFTRAAEGLGQRLTGVETLGQDLAGRRRTIARLDTEHKNASAALVEKEEAHLGAAERLAALEETLSAPLQEILGQIGEAERSLSEAKATWQAEDERARRSTTPWSRPNRRTSTAGSPSGRH